VRSVGVSTGGLGSCPGGQWALWNRRYTYVPTRVPKSVASVATKTTIPHQPFARA